MKKIILSFFSQKTLYKAIVWLRDYNKMQVQLLGIFDVLVACQLQRKTLPLYVAHGNRPYLFGRNWLQTFTLDWKRVFEDVKEVNNVDCRSQLYKLLKKYHAMFQQGDGV